MTVGTQGAFGELLPAYASNKLPLMEPSLSRDIQAARFEVVAIRIDPPEIRLVWGIFLNFARPGQAPRILAMDTALHTFYKMTDEKGFLNELKQISQLSRSDVTQNLALSVHPTLQREGFTGAYGKAFKALILKSVGEKNLFKLTFMAMSAIHLKWDFGGFNIANGKATPLQIAKVNTDKVQIFTNDSFPPVEFNGGIGPAPKGQDAFNRLVSDSRKSQVSEDDKLLEAHLTARKIENPSLETPTTGDCVSCHVAQPVRLFTEAQKYSLKETTESRYVNAAFNLKNNSPDRSRTDNVHAFGWFSDMPSINQRTINETAFVAAKLNAKHK